MCISDNPDDEAEVAPGSAHNLTATEDPNEQAWAIVAFRQSAPATTALLGLSLAKESQMPPTGDVRIMESLA